MNQTKITAAFFIVSVGIIGAYFIVSGNSLTASSQADQNSNNNGGNQPLSGQPVQMVNNSDINNVPGISPASILKQADINNADISKSSDNLTNVIGQSLFGGIRTLDQSGINPFGSIDVNNPKTQSIIQQSVNQISASNIKLNTAEVSDGDFKTSSDNSKQAKIAYLSDVRNIFDRQITNPLLWISSADQIISDIDDDCFYKTGTSLNGQRAEFFKSLVGGYLNLSVPSDWLALHKELVSFFNNGQIFFSAFSSCSDDPVKAGILTDNFTSWLNQSWPKLYGDLVQKYKDVGLNYDKLNTN